MLSLVARLASLGWDWIEPGEKKSIDPCEEVSLKEKRFTGRITSINPYEEYGIVNRGVYFSFEVVYAQQELGIGDTVLVHASKKESHHAWMASYVELQKRYCDIKSPKTCDKLSNGDVKHFQNHTVSTNNQAMKRMETVEQTVSECNRKVGKLRDGFEFEVEDGEIEFLPVVGDILIAIVEYTDSGKRVVSWKPKEIKCIEGEITACENDCGVINDNIMFFKNSCRRKKIKVLLGLKVSAMVVSSEQGLFKWRAFSLTSAIDDGDVTETRKPQLESGDGIFVTEQLNFANLCLGHENELKVVVQNLTPSKLCIFDCCFEKKNGIFFVGTSMKGEEVIPGFGAFELTIHCKTESIGQHEDILLFEFLDFIIKRAVTVTVIDPLQHLLNPTAPFSSKNKKRPTQLDCEDLVVIPGRKVFKPIQNFTNKLPPANIPKYLMRAIRNRDNLKQAIPKLFDNLNMRNYVNKFSTLLHLEEIQARLDMEKFDIHEAILRKKGEFMCLEVDGLAEGRPSLIMGDKAILVPPYKCNVFAYEGYIHDVQCNDILLKFNDTFHHVYGGESYDVRFELNRTNFRRLHQCVHHVSENHTYALFPAKLNLQEPLIDLNLSNSEVVCNGFKNKPAIKLKNNNSKFQESTADRNVTSNKMAVNGITSLEDGSKSVVEWKNTTLNWKQKEAVMRILECRCRPLPYIIFGPPGTGKTVTLVEAVVQVYKNLKKSRIIICTPSNSAADLVTHRIIESEVVIRDDMVRLNSYQRHIDSIPEFIRPYCQDKDCLDYISQYRIIISTCSTAGSLYSIGLCNDFFTHVFIDEAGQLMEPESNIALGFVDSSSEGQVVMAGDPQQLGPVLRSTHAVMHGLQISYLERLMTTALYARNEGKFGEYGGYNPLLVTMLEESYRSHPDILRFPSEMFYFSRVICRFPMDVECKLAQCDLLPHPGFPVIFHGIRGEEMREQNSPSWFNASEVIQVTMYLRRLYDLGLTPADVGVIAPYKKQVEKIRVMLGAMSLESCKIGSVEEFQGQERRAIIISTVRSSDRFVNSDILYNLGFISNPKRLNVAITRAQELLIVVGNPHLLSKDYYWHSFVRYCVVNGCYTGCGLPLSFLGSAVENE